MTLTLRDHRARRRMSMRDLEQASGVSTNTINRIEKGLVAREKIRPITQKRIAAALQIEPDDIAEFQLEPAYPKASPAEWEALLSNARQAGITLARHPLAPATPAQLAEVDARADSNDREGWYADDPDGTGLWSEEHEAPRKAQVPA